MAVAFDATGPSTAHATTSPLTWTHVVGASATALVAGVVLDALNGTLGTFTVTAGGTSMGSPLVTGIISGGGGNTGHSLWVWGLLSPPTGSISIIATQTGGETFDAFIGTSMSFTGATGFGTPVTANGTTTTATVSATGVAASSVVAGFNGQGSNISSPSPGTNEQIINVLGSGGSTSGNGACAINTGTGSVTITWTSGGATSWAAAVVEVQGAGGVVGGTKTVVPQAVKRAALW